MRFAMWLPFIVALSCAPSPDEVRAGLSGDARFPLTALDGPDDNGDYVAHFTCAGHRVDTRYTVPKQHAADAKLHSNFGKLRDELARTMEANCQMVASSAQLGGDAEAQQAIDQIEHDHGRLKL